MTEHDLFGYLTNSLDAEQRQQIESSLRSNPTLCEQLDRFRGALKQLENEPETAGPPAGLADRTIARLDTLLARHEPQRAAVSAEPAARPLKYSNAPFPRAPRDEPETRVVGGRFRPDLLVACGIALFASGLIFSAIGKVRARNEVFACQNALRITHTGLAGYADAHNDRYPQIGPNAPAGSFATTLTASGQLPVNFHPACPSYPAPATSAATSPAVGYTYTLGYRSPGGELIGMRRPGAGVEEHDLVPIAADFPAASAAPAGAPCPHNSGMNVLYAGGNVRLATSPLVGPNRDHIFLNQHGQVGAGTGLTDAVLGRPGDRP